MPCCTVQSCHVRRCCQRLVGWLPHPATGASSPSDLGLLHNAARWPFRRQQLSGGPLRPAALAGRPPGLPGLPNAVAPAHQAGQLAGGCRIVQSCPALAVDCVELLRVLRKRRLQPAQVAAQGSRVQRLGASHVPLGDDLQPGRRARLSQPPNQQTSGGAAAARQSAAQQIGVAARLHGGKTTRRIKWAGVRQTVGRASGQQAAGRARRHSVAQRHACGCGCAPRRWCIYSVLPFAPAPLLPSRPFCPCCRCSVAVGGVNMPLEGLFVGGGSS